MAKSASFRSAFATLLNNTIFSNTPVGGRSTARPPEPLSAASTSQQEFMDFIRQKMDVANTRGAKYHDYDKLDDQPLTSRALDIYASLITQGEVDEDETSSSFQIVAENPRQQKIFQDFETRLNLKHRLHSLVRTLCKYGMNPQEVVFKEFVGVERMRYIPAKLFKITDERLDIKGQEFPYSEIDDNGSTVQKFREFQIAAFRLDTDESRLYGRSLLEPVRRTSKIIDVLETALAFRELNRAMQKWLWLVDSTGLNPEEASAYVSRMMNQHQKPRYIDNTGNLNLSRNPMTDMGDIGLPVYKDGANVDIKPLASDSGTGNLGVINHFLAKFFGGIGIPGHYFSFNINNSPRLATAYTYDDIMLARSVYKYQSALISTMYDVYLHESQFHGIEDDSFKLILPVMGTVDDLRKYQIMNLKIQIAQTLRINANLVDDDWVFKFLKFDKPDVAKFKSFRAVVRSEEQLKMQAAADGVFVSPTTTMGNPGDSPFDVVTMAARQEAQGFAGGAPPPPAIGEQMLIQEKLQSERTFQELVRSQGIRNTLDDIYSFSKWRLQQADPNNTGDLNGIPADLAK